MSMVACTNAHMSTGQTPGRSVCFISFCAADPSPPESHLCPQLTIHIARRAIQPTDPHHHKYIRIDLRISNEFITRFVASHNKTIARCDATHILLYSICSLPRCSIAASRCWRTPPFGEVEFIADFSSPKICSDDFGTNVCTQAVRKNKLLHVALKSAALKTSALNAYAFRALFVQLVIRELTSTTHPSE